MADPELATLVTRAQKGERLAFEELVRRTSRIVYAQIAATVRDRQKAEDLTQETFVAAWNALEAINEPTGFVSWLLTIARNTVLDAAKFEKRKKRASPSAAGEAAERIAATATPAEAAELVEMRERMLRMLEELPEDYRRPLSLRYLAGADYEMIRRQLNLTDGSLRGLLNRGMALLRERMSKLESRP